MASSDQRRRQLAREKFERQQQRRAEAHRKTKRRNVIIAAALAVVVAAGAAAYASVGLTGDAKNKDSADSAAPSPSKPADPCGKPAKGEPSKAQFKKEPAMSIDTSAAYAMKLRTTCGEIGIELDAENAPRTVNSFNFLAGKKYFDHSKCHRLVDQGIFVLQCGDPTGTGQGTPGYTIPDENLKDSDLKGDIYPAGTVAMANRYNGKDDKTRNTGGSQFFLVYQDSKLPPNYTPFGKITKGMDVLKKIAAAGSTPDPATGNTAPNATVVIDEAAVTKS